MTTRTSGLIIRSGSGTFQQCDGTIDCSANNEANPRGRIRSSATDGSYHAQQQTVSNNKQGLQRAAREGHFLLPHERWFVDFGMRRRRALQGPPDSIDQNYGPEGTVLFLAMLSSVLPGVESRSSASSWSS